MLTTNDKIMFAVYKNISQIEVRLLTAAPNYNALDERWCPMLLVSKSILQYKYFSRQNIAYHRPSNQVLTLNFNS